MAIIDFYDDPTGAVLLEIIKAAGAANIPDYVRSAGLHPSETIRSERELFAWPSAEKFACDTPADTWLSAQYFAKTAHLVPFQYHDTIASNIKAAADMFNLDLSSLEVKQASEVLGDDAFLVVESLPVFDELVKRASKDNTVDNGDGTVTLRMYPVNDVEAIKKAALWFPRGLTGELVGHRQKVAAKLTELCEQHGIDLTTALIDEMRPIKRSHLLSHLQQRVSYILAHNTQAERNNGILKAASDTGRSLPYSIEEMSLIDGRLVTGYQELMKMAYEDSIPKRFWDLFTRMDKAAGFSNSDNFTPVSSLNRELEDDLLISTCKLAGQIAYLPQVMEKVSTEMWADLAPEVLECMYDFTKVAKIIDSLPELSQRAILAKIRGY